MKLEDGGISHSLLCRLESQLDALELILVGVDDTAMTSRAESGNWSAHEQLAHLARYHEIFLERLDRMLREDSPLLPRYSAEEDPEWSRWVGRPTREVLARLLALRRTLIERTHRLSRAELERAGVHSKMGEMSLSLWIEFFLVHEAHHLYAVLLRARGA